MHARTRTHTHTDPETQAHTCRPTWRGFVELDDVCHVTFPHVCVSAHCAFLVRIDDACPVWGGTDFVGFFGFQLFEFSMFTRFVHFSGLRLDIHVVSCKVDQPPTGNLSVCGCGGVGRVWGEEATPPYMKLPDAPGSCCFCSLIATYRAL